MSATTLNDTEHRADRNRSGDKSLRDLALDHIRANKALKPVERDDLCDLWQLADPDTGWIERKSWKDILKHLEIKSRQTLANRFKVWVPEGYVELHPTELINNIRNKESTRYRLCIPDYNPPSPKNGLGTDEHPEPAGISPGRAQVQKSYTTNSNTQDICEGSVHTPTGVQTTTETKTVHTQQAECRPENTKPDVNRENNIQPVICHQCGQPGTLRKQKHGTRWGCYDCNIHLSELIPSGANANP